MEKKVKNIAIGILVIFLLIISYKMDHVKAATTNWSLQQARIQTDHSGTNQWSTYRTITGTSSYVFSSSDLSYPVNAVAYKFQAPVNFTTDDNVEFLVGYKSTPDSLGYKNCYVENSATGEREEITVTQEQASSGWYRITISFEPKTDYTAGDTIYVKVNFFESYVTDFRVAVEDYNLTQGIGSIIKNQTNIIVNQNEQIINALDQDHTYNSNTADLLPGWQEETNLRNEEEDLMNDLDFDISDMQVSINANSSAFIWQIVDLLRSINSKIVLLFTSVLGLGIMKMVLNR